MNLDRLEKMQNRAARAIPGYPPWHSATELREKLIQNRWLIHKYYYVFKCLNDLVPPYLHSKFSLVPAKLLAINQCHLRSIESHGAIDWNVYTCN